MGSTARSDARIRHWPVYGLRLLIEDLELRFPDDDDLAAMADLAEGGIHPPERMPFASPWTDAPVGELGRNLLQFHWRSRAEWRPENWSLPFVVIRDGVVVGTQGIGAEEFTGRRMVETGSWVGAAFQGQGIGTAMRTAVLAFAFDRLGALEARSGAYLDNAASLAVSRSLGYRDDGTTVYAPRGMRTIEQRLLMTREQWRAVSRPHVEVRGAAACRRLFGLDDEA
jgi:RimJ/RimL family protein N-acetyltransferase